MSSNCPKGDEHCIRGCKPWECRDGWPDEPPLKPDIAALKKRLAEDPGFAAQVTGDRLPTPGCHTPDGCRENGCLGWCDEHRPDRPPTPVGWSDTDWLKHLEEIQQDQAVYHRGPLPETGWD